MIVRKFLAVAIVAVVGMGAASQASAIFASGGIRGQNRAGSIKDQYIVVLKDGAVAPQDVATKSDDLARKHNGRVGKRFTAAMRGFSVQMTETQAQDLSKDSSVAYVEQDAIATASDVQKSPTWGLDRIDQRAPSNTYEYSTTGSGVTAYVIDTGVRISHAEFGGRASNGYDFISNDPIAQDCYGHGTHVAGTIGGKTYGVAKQVKIVAVRVLDCNGSGATSTVIAGIDWVTKNHVGPSVANMSLGGSMSSAENDAVKRSIVSGVTYAVSAGNGNTDACTQSPASTPEALTVGNVDNSDTKSSSSNYGTCLDIWAPGTNVVSSYYTSDTATTTMTGTSMASPHVAGAAALLLSKTPSMTPAQVADALSSSATTNRVNQPGTGSPNKMLFIGNPNTPQ